MKAAYLSILALVFGLSSFAQSGHRIEINVEGFTGSEAYLAYYFGEKQYLSDTAEVVNGSFVFEGDEPLDGGMFLVVFPPDNRYFEVVVDKDQYFTMTTDTADFVANMVVTGSRDNQVFYNDLIFINGKREVMKVLQEEKKATAADSDKGKAIQQKLDAMDAEVIAYRKKLIKDNDGSLYAAILAALNEPEIPDAPVDENGNVIDSLFAFKYYKKHYFDNVDLSDGRLLRTPIVYPKVNNYIDRLTVRYPDSIIIAVDYIIGQTRGDDDVFRYWVVTFTNKYAASKIMGMDAVYAHMVERYYMSGEAWWADEDIVAKMTERALAISPTLIGKTAPNFVVRDVNNQPRSLHGVVADYTILYFWSYSCGHCQKITPKLTEAFEAYRDKGVKIFSVNIDGEVETWKKDLVKYGLDMEGVINTEDIQRTSGYDQLYDVRSTPRIFILDKNKTIIAKHISVDGLQEILNRELGIETEASEEAEEDHGE